MASIACVGVMGSGVSPSRSASTEHVKPIPLLHVVGDTARGPSVFFVLMRTGRYTVGRCEHGVKHFMRATTEVWRSLAQDRIEASEARRKGITA